MNDDLMYYVRNALNTNSSSTVDAPNIFRPGNVLASARASEPAHVIKVSLNKGDLAKAKALLEEALKSRPDDVELQYLSRLVARPSSL